MTAQRCAGPGQEVEARLQGASALLRYGQQGRLDQALAMSGAAALLEKALAFVTRERCPRRSR
jgi:hypothetical protein